MRWNYYGPDALLITFASEVNERSFLRGRTLSEFLEGTPFPALRNFVPSFTTILLEFDGPVDAREADRIVQQLDSLATRAWKQGTTDPITLDVRYDGADLQRVMEHCGLSQAELIRIHSEPVYKVHLLGFAPGFPYLWGLDARLHTPRLPQPRARVTPGSVGIGGEHTGVYPLETPGGWNLIGTTDARLFNPSPAMGGSRTENAFLLKPGDRVRFRPVSK